MPSNASRRRRLLPRYSFYISLDHFRAVLFLVRLFVVDIYEDDSRSHLLLFLFLLPTSYSIHATVREGSGRCYFAFSKHANGLVIAKLLNEFSIPQRNSVTASGNAGAGKRAMLQLQKRHGTRSDAIFMTSYVERLLYKEHKTGTPLFFIYYVTVEKQYRTWI